MLQPLPMNDRHLPPCSIQPHVPRNVAGRSTSAAIFFESMKPIVKRIVDLPLDQPAANPQRPRIDAAQNLLNFKPLLLRLPSVGHDQFFPNN